MRRFAAAAWPRRLPKSVSFLGMTGDRLVRPSYKQGMAETDDTLFVTEAPEGADHFGRHSTGILPSHVLKRLIRARREIRAGEDMEDSQIQPASSTKAAPTVAAAYST